ncbi:MAG: hypothetical protein GQ536_00650 [Candidatus Aminicenantes bacterium]|nr:hypothetical protein [Candidatus Aminicenantes bacterium]
MKKAFMKLFLFSITVMLLVSLSSAAQIHLKNGVVLRGEIVSSDENSVLFNEQDMGLLKLSNEKILKIVKREEVKKEKTYSAPLELQDDYFDAYARDLRRKGPISFSISGGLSNINGGDFNEAIQSINETFISLGDLLPDATLSLDWEEVKWIPSYKGELLLNLSPFLSIGLGGGYLTKTNPGILSFSYGDSWLGDDAASDYQYIFEDDYIAIDAEHKLTFIPLTFSIYLYVPMGNMADFFITGGAGYYLGKLEATQNYASDYDYQEDYYDSSDTYLFSYYDRFAIEGTKIYEATCNTIGYHAGAGLDIKFSPNMSLVIEGNYRSVTFSEWEGTATDDWDYYIRDGFTGSYYEAAGTENEEFAGKLWYYESIDSLGGITMGQIDLFEVAPDPDDYSNIRLAEINLNGFSIKAGIKITF